MTVCIGPRTRPAAPSSGERDAPFRVGHIKAAPAPPLARYVEYYWLTRWDRRGHAPRTAAAILAPCMHLQIRDGRAEIMGVVRGTFRMRIERIGCVIGVRFRPGGFHPFARQPATRWTDRTVPAEEALGMAGGAAAAWARTLWDAIVECRGDADAQAAMVASHFDEFLLARQPARDVVAEEMASLVELLATRADVRRVGDLARASGRSERTLHRLFLRYVGVSPAWVIRRYRLHAAAERLTACPRADVRALAYELGYADQAHFIRDFRALVGVTPGAYARARCSPVTSDSGARAARAASSD